MGTILDLVDEKMLLIAAWIVVNEAHRTTFASVPTTLNLGEILAFYR